MHTDFQLTHQPIQQTPLSAPKLANSTGAWVEFRGTVRGLENNQPISALEYEAYPEMAIRQLQQIASDLTAVHPVLAISVIHRLGLIPVGETAIRVQIAATHRTEAFAFLAAFMDRLKQDVPIWKVRSQPPTPHPLP
jgi:molybdopterin synthase catalytic subunit